MPTKKRIKFAARFEGVWRESIKHPFVGN